MNKLLILLSLAAVVAIATAANKDELLAKKMAFKKAKGKIPENRLEEIHKLKQMDLSPEEIKERVGKMKYQSPMKAAPAKKPSNAQDAAHKKKFAADRENAKLELATSKKQFQKELSDVKGSAELSLREKQRKIIGMKQDFMAKVSDLKERMGLDPSKTDRMAWKQAQLKKGQRPMF
ncbi:uncharacterized protein [Amphiura filiformis]|uniref:uncharacterized protein n=1 Tax=Amphiura filiformis TaxID=82378 RepID=UPI003B220D89